MKEQHDIAPDRAGLIYAAVTHKACSVLAGRGLKGAVTLKALLYKPVFLPMLTKAIHAVALDRREDWPQGEARLPTPDPKRFAQAVAAFRDHGERGLFEALDIDALSFIDKAAGRLGWIPKPDARYRIVVLDEAGMAHAGEVQDLRERCELLVLAGDAEGQLQPIATDEDKQHASRESLRSALAPASLAGLGAAQYRLRRNMRSANSLALAKEIVIDRGLPFFEVLSALRAECPDVVWVKDVPLEVVDRGAPVLVWRNLTRLWVNLSARQARGWTDDRIHVGQTLVVGSVEARLAAVAPRSLVKNARWRVIAADANGLRFDIADLANPETIVRGATLRLAEFPGGATTKWKQTHGFEFPAFGSRFAMVSGVLGEAATVEKAQGDSVDEAVIALDDFRALAQWGKCDDDGVESWRRKLSVAIGRARHRVWMVTGRELNVRTTPPAEIEASR